MSRKTKKIRPSQLKFYNPPPALLASGTKEGVELGGSKVIVSIDGEHNLYNEGKIYSELSWGEFYEIEGLEDQIDTFTTKEYESVREDANALAGTITKTLLNIMKQGRLFYGICDFECDAFMGNIPVPGLHLDQKLINKLMESHKTTRDEKRFPKSIKDAEGKEKIKITIQGTNKEHLYLPGYSLEERAVYLRKAKGFATGLVIASDKAANLFMLNDNIIFKEGKESDFYIDQDCLTVIEMGIPRKVLFPISWFRIDLGILSLETLELWDEINANPRFREILDQYEQYINQIIIEEYKETAVSKSKGGDLESEFYQLTGLEKKKVLNDMAEAIKILTEKYNE